MSLFWPEIGLWADRSVSSGTNGLEHLSQSCQPGWAWRQFPASATGCCCLKILRISEKEKNCFLANSTKRIKRKKCTSMEGLIRTEFRQRVQAINLRFKNMHIKELKFLIRWLKLLFVFFSLVVSTSKHSLWKVQKYLCLGMQVKTAVWLWVSLYRFIQCKNCRYGQISLKRSLRANCNLR